jgi:hypothetical protein
MTGLRGAFVAAPGFGAAGSAENKFPAPNIMNERASKAVGKYFFMG